jgi:excisionase family DNA binding protein
MDLKGMPGVGNLPQKDLLDVDDVASFLGVGHVTIWRWCREGALPCIKVGRAWRLRREVLEEFLRSSERSQTLTGRLRNFLEVPDNVLAIAEDWETMCRLDAAFFRVAEANGGTLVKYVNLEEEEYLDELRLKLEEAGLEVSRLEGEGRMRFIAETGPPGERVKTLRRIISEEAQEGRSVWVNFNWENELDLEAALGQQEEITRLINGSRFVVKTTVPEEELDEWPGSLQRRVQVHHAGTMWLSQAGLSLSRVSPPPAL